MKEKKEADLLKEAQRTSYGLRSLFFHRKLQELRFQQLARDADRLTPQNYKWNLKKLNISRSAWRYVRKLKIKETQIFCHPKVVRENPKLIAYYRCLAGIPQKGMHKLVFNTSSFENGRRIDLHTEKAIEISRVINEFVSAIIDSEIEFSLTDAILLLHATAGVQIDGSWRNAIGEEATRQVKSLIVKSLTTRKVVYRYILVDRSEKKTLKDINIDKLAGLTLKNKYEVKFGSEPDVSFFDPEGPLIGIIEVKGGIDEAGALERYGAAKKTFDEALDKNPRSLTMYLASCMTKTVKKRIEADRSVKRIFNLTSVLLDDVERQKFLDEINWWLRL